MKCDIYVIDKQGYYRSKIANKARKLFGQYFTLFYLFGCRQQYSFINTENC